jgi:hypothetical protein
MEDAEMEAHRPAGSEKGTGTRIHELFADIDTLGLEFPRDRSKPRFVEFVEPASPGEAMDH